MKTVVYPVLLSGFLVLFASCRGGENERSQAMLVKTTKATTVTAESNKEFPFIAQPFRTTELSFRVGGPVDQFDVYAGNRYKRGSIIAGIDPRDFRIRCKRTEAIYFQAKAEFERIQVLYEKENLSASAYEKAKADYVSAKAAYETAANELEDTRLIAPFDGYVGEVYLEKYQDVKATQPVLSFIETDRLRIEIYVTQDIAATVQSGDTVQLRFDMHPRRVFKAPVVEVSKGTTRNNLSYLLTVVLSNDDGELLAGMSGKAVLNMPQVASATGVSVPQTALCHRPSEGDYVWVINPDNRQVNRRKVTVDKLLANGSVKLCDGLQPGETVAISGLRFLSDGMMIETPDM